MSGQRLSFLTLIGLFVSHGYAHAEEAIHGVVENAGDIANEIVTDIPHQIVDAASHVTDHDGSHTGGGLPQFDFASWPSQIFWLCVFFVILYTIFSKTILPAIGSSLQNRQDHIANNIKEADDLTAKAQAIEKDVREALKQAAHSASVEIQAIEKETKDLSSQSLSDFRRKYEDTISAAERRIQNATNDAMADMQQIVASLASKMTQKIAGISADTSQAETVVRSLSEKKKAA